MTQDEREGKLIDLLTEVLRALPGLANAVATVLISMVVGWTIVNTTRALAGKSTNAQFHILVDAKLTKNLGIAGPAALGGAAVVYRRRKRRLKARVKRTNALPKSSKSIEGGRSQ